MPVKPGARPLVGGGYGSAPLFWLAESLRAAGTAADVVLGAARENRLYGSGSTRASIRSR